MLTRAMLPLVALLSVCFARPGREYNRHPFAAALQARQSGDSAESPLRIDLGYEIYEGYLNSTSNLNTWNGYET
jgi:hypothetical protein